MRPSQSSNTTTVLSSGQVSDRPETPDRKVSKGCESTGFEETCRSGSGGVRRPSPSTALRQADVTEDEAVPVL